MTEKKDGPENYTLEQLLKRFDYIRFQLIKNQASMIVAMQKVALEPGDENPQLHRLAAKLGSNHLDNKPLSEVLNQFPNIGKRPLADIFGENITVVTGLLALPTGEEEPKTQPKKERKIQPKTQEIRPVEITGFLKGHPQVKNLFSDSELWEDGDETRWISVSELKSRIIHNLIVDKNGHTTKENLVYALIQGQIQKFLKDNPRSIEIYKVGNKTQKVFSDTTTLDLFIQLSHLKDIKNAKYRLVDATDLPPAEVKKNVNQQP
jgi:hypothetical protein